MVKPRLKWIAVIGFILFTVFYAWSGDGSEIRRFADTTGFAREGWQVDKLMERIRKVQRIPLEKSRKNGGNNPE